MSATYPGAVACQSLTGERDKGRPSLLIHTIGLAMACGGAAMTAVRHSSS